MTTNMTSGSIDSRKDFDEDARGQYKFWLEELRNSQKSRRKWHKQGDKIVKRFIDARNNYDRNLDGAASVPFKLNLFHSNVTTLTSMLYGNIPQVDVSRRYADPNDDVSRVAAEIMERLLNNDIAENGEEVNCVLRSTLQDRLLSGLGCARVRYDFESETKEIEVNGVIEEQEVLITEEAPIDYFFWRDMLWSWGRSWSELTWLAYRVYLTKDEVAKQFGEEVADNLEYKKQLVMDDSESINDPDESSAWNKAEVWEIWDKTKRQVVFLSIGYDKVLDTVEDPLGLKGFFASPPFFIANVTTTLYTPTPDYHLAQDLYNAVDNLQTRISIITEAVKAVGVYDSSADGVKRMFKEGMENDLIPVENWAMFSEKGGLAGQVDWMPIEAFTKALAELTSLRDQTLSLLQQVTGMSEIMRGGTNGQYEGVGQAQLQAKFGSIRIQALQDEFATFAGNLMQLKAEVISRHFSPQTIVQRSCIEYSYDSDLAPQAIELIKNTRKAMLKVEIRPESVAMVDYAQLKAERTDYINALSTFFQSAAPMIQQDEAMKPFLMQLLKWGLAGFKGASEIEGVVDKAIDQAMQQAKQGQGKPSPEQQKMQMAMQLEGAKLKGKMQEIEAKSQADVMTRKADLNADIQTTIASNQAKMKEIEADMFSKIAETRAKMEADILVEQVQANANIAQTQAGAEMEIEKDIASTRLEIGKESAKTSFKINEIQEAAKTKIREQNLNSSIKAPQDD